MLKPYEPNVGAHGAAFGLLGMNFVELLQAWKLVEHPERPLIKLIVYTVIGLAIGFMPEVCSFLYMDHMTVGWNLGCAFFYQTYKISSGRFNTYTNHCGNCKHNIISF